LELQSNFTIQGQPRTSEGLNSQEYTRLEDKLKLQGICFFLEKNGVSFLLKMIQA
jgi:hypothetical protein